MIDRTGYEHLLPQPTEGVITTTVIAEREVGPDPEYVPPGQTRANIIPVPVYGREGGAFPANWGDADAHGNTFAAASTGLVENNNITWVEFRYAPSRQPLGQDVAWRIDPIWKIDTFKCWPAMRDDNPDMADIIAFLTTHTIGQATRRIFWEFAVIPNVWHYSVANQHLSRGGPGAYRGEQLPGQEEEVDYERILREFAAALNNRDHVLAQAMSKQIKNNAQIGAANALNESYRDTEGSFYKGFGPFKRFADTVWEQVHKVMRERGVGQEPPPPPQPEEEG